MDPRLSAKARLEKYKLEIDKQMMRAPTAQKRHYQNLKDRLRQFFTENADEDTLIDGYKGYAGSLEEHLKTISKRRPETEQEKDKNQQEKEVYQRAYTILKAMFPGIEKCLKE